MPGNGKQKRRLTKDEALTAAAVVMLLFSAMITWNIYSLLIFAAVIILLVAWYVRS